jgi:radical SAM superfamily enzyme YgiQ (UPF0313 family)
MEYLESAGFKKFNIIDETFPIDKERTKNLLNRIIKSKNQGKLTNITTKIKSRIDTIDDQLLSIMKDADIDMIQIGVETINIDRLSDLSKNLKEYNIEKKLESILMHGISLNPIFIFGYKGQSIENLKTDISFIKRICSKPNITTFLAFNTPHPGSHDWNNSSINGLNVLTGNLNYFNHKMLVSVPTSLGKPSEAMNILKESYNETVEFIKMEHENPYLTDLEYIYEENPELNNITNITC